MQVNNRQRLIIATNNFSKANEILLILKDNLISSIPDINFEFIHEHIPSEEFGMTYEQNALIKAQIYFSRFNTPILAEDSGLEIKILNNRPGIQSNKVVNGDDLYHCRWALYELKDKIDRSAKFISAIALVTKNLILITRGEIEGTITKEVSGDKGFSYDSIFIPKGYTKTFGELDIEEKNKISHRSIAVNKLIHIIESFNTIQCFDNTNILFD